MTDPEAKAALAELLAEYANLIDEDRLEDWLDLFADECIYRVVPRENFDLGQAGAYACMFRRAITRCSPTHPLPDKHAGPLQGNPGAGDCGFESRSGRNARVAGD